MELKTVKECKNIISCVAPGSIAESEGVQVGDELIAINGRKIVDIIDYIFLTADESLEVEIKKASGETHLFVVRKEFYDDLGIDFDNPIMDEAKSCRNNCVFCFIDQMPQGMRETLYFKDDDSRLSFLQGNFVTLTNLSDSDIDRMIEYNISPINVSVHTTNPELRVKMLNNRFAGDVLTRLKRLIENRITVNAQIVLCPGYNDGLELERTLNDLSRLAEGLESVAIVPVGLTKFREGLAPLRGFTKEESMAVIEQVHRLQETFYEALGTRFAFLSDEFYIMADVTLPDAEDYEDFIQLENGVGLIRKFELELLEALAGINPDQQAMDSPIEKHKVTLATGTSAYKFMQSMAKLVGAKLPIEIDVVAIDNDFFGRSITVAGLIVGEDLKAQLGALKDTLGELIVLPRAMMKGDEEVFLDNVTVEALSQYLNKPVLIVEVDGWQFVDQLVSWFGIKSEN